MIDANRLRAHGLGLGSMHIIIICEVRFALSSLPDAVCRTVFLFKSRRKSPIAVPYYFDLEFSLPSFSSSRFYRLHLFTLSAGCRLPLGLGLSCYTKRYLTYTLFTFHLGNISCIFPLSFLSSE
jgi:hypothetical protein